MRPHTTRQKVQAGGFGKVAFAIDWESRAAICPSGSASRYWTEGLDHNRRPVVRIRFATDTCAPCPVREQCTRSTRYGRQLTVRPQDQDALLEQVRADQTTDEWKARYAARAGVEGTIHQAVSATGARRTRYFGLPKTRLAHGRVNGGYNRALVEHLLPAVWDEETAYGIKNELVPDADMPKACRDVKAGSPLLAHLADIRHCWRSAELTTTERQSLLLRYGLDLSYAEMPTARGVRKQYVDGYDTEIYYEQVCLPHVHRDGRSPKESC